MGRNEQVKNYELPVWLITLDYCWARMILRLPHSYVVVDLRNALDPPSSTGTYMQTAVQPKRHGRRLA
jgi:hypothetical protein